MWRHKTISMIGLLLLGIQSNSYAESCDANDACQDICNQVYTYSQGKLQSVMRSNTCIFDTSKENQSGGVIIANINCLCSVPTP